MQKHSLSGVYAPVLTPFKQDGSIDPKAYACYCSWLLSQGAGLALFGTNSEANSLSLDERLTLLEHVLGQGLPATRMMPGTGACALPDAVTLCRAAARAGAPAVLMLPPFFYKDVTEDGLFAFFAETIERVGDVRLNICLYHIPQVSGVPVSLSLIERLLSRFPETIAGIKDSGGDMGNTLAMIRAFPGFQVFCGSERFLVETIAEGGAGCISASANLNPAAIVSAYARARDGNTEDSQTSLNAFRSVFDGMPMIAALKRMAAEYGGHKNFARVRPPLSPLSEEHWSMLRQRLAVVKFAAPGLHTAFAGN